MKPKIAPPGALTSKITAGLPTDALVVVGTTTYAWLPSERKAGCALGLASQTWYTDRAYPQNL
jgi:hypothetical protein